MPGTSDDDGAIRFDEATASRFAALALANIAREYPHKLDHVIGSDADIVVPRQLHPAFHGSFDWHSCVHMHWLLARIRRRHRALPVVAEIGALLDHHFADDAIAAEVAYVTRPDSASFERPYGWAWLLKLAAELRAGNDADAVRWSRALQPLADAFVARYLDFLPRARYPVRHGVHSNSAFGLAFALDYAQVAGDRRLCDICAGKAREWYACDRDAPAEWEPSGADFLSPVLIEADLMRRVFDAASFGAWLDAFLPRFHDAEPGCLFTPAEVDDRSDGQIVHLDGLNLSRAWCYAGIARALSQDDVRTRIARNAAASHLAAGWRGLASGDFAGSHWLASFAVLAIDE